MDLNNSNESAKVNPLKLLIVVESCAISPPDNNITDGSFQGCEESVTAPWKAGAYVPWRTTVFKYF
jgi:hypothetical protein